ncbi:MAG: NAD(P)-binding domain-containing protein [Clostridiales bacterium]|nr:NAD(P)-binding domain-containing protein [Clostridiales bacterium]
MNIGIIGVGVIGSAIVKGFCYNNNQEHQLFISPRGEQLSLELSATYNQVTRCKNNQEVLDQSEYVILSVLPQMGMEIISELSFRKDHKVINLMSDKKLEDIKAVIGKTSALVHMVPLSFISNRKGPIALYPRNDDIICLMDKLGDVIAVDEVGKIESIAAITGLMTSYYALMHDIANWGCAHDLTQEESKSYTTYFFEALSTHARDSDLEVLSTEMTPGGLNERALKYIHQQNGFKPWVDILDPILEGLRKK